MQNIKGALFDLDGVIVDTARYHYLAWRRLASRLGVDFTEKHNERLKGVSRMVSLDILLEIAGLQFSTLEKEKMAEEKNNWYVESLKSLDQSALLPGAKEYLVELKKKGVLVALGSASKNAPLILDCLEITSLFDAIIDGNSVEKAKPDPEVFLKGAEALCLAPSDCIVFEDSLAGIQAAKAGGMRAVAVGTKENLPGADYYITALADLLS